MIILSLTFRASRSASLGSSPNRSSDVFRKVSRISASLSRENSTLIIKEKQACFSFIIKVLFSRDSDAEIRETFLKTSEDLFGDEPNDADLDALKVKLRMIMMRLMNERIQRSLSHVAIQSGKGSAEDEARLAGDNPLAALEGA